MLILVAVFFSWSVIEVTNGSSTSVRYGLPLFSGLPPEAQAAVKTFESSPPPNGTSEVVNGILVVNMTAVQNATFSDVFKPNFIKATPGEPIVIILNSPQVITGFFIRLPDGVVNVNAIPGTPSYVYFLAPNQPGNYTWREPELAGYDFSYMTGTLEVV
ncbi:proton pump complex quinol oxidase subunit SoxA [Metallosphaera tengchongensis]|nr:proton pump complex quinol oxidase subunit SoxA [Metallosphaera tengchongensis]